MKFIFKVVCLFTVLYSACVPAHKSTNPIVTINLDTLVMPLTGASGNDSILSIYRGSKPRIHDLIHTALDVRPDFNTKTLHGKAILTLKPYFYSSDTLVIDAKGMDILDVSLYKEYEKTKLHYSYDSLKLTITLDTIYSREDVFSVFIEYISKPENIRAKGSAAIKESKGLYFINADGKNPSKPKQLWTQGETENSSVWFPTIDSPNERMTQEISITVDTAFTTISNGLLLYSNYNVDGTRTDVWKQNVSAAPYLSMIAVGTFSVIHDKWKNMDVIYYVDSGYKKVAPKIFGNTPEMLSFFSEKLGVEYPWEKYAQVVVHDYVSGAMENTGAVIFGNFIQKTERELIDKNHEDIIAHELFHHWFGNLVTCESWSNLPLNESFATYGEYLWNEYKYGQDEADLSLQTDLNVYLSNAERGHSPELIRYHYFDKEDMFDAISYQKGGRVLHMLRKYVGDDAFFNALNLYLKTNKFKSAEIHHLRLAFEQVTGEDLNWFFNQWFMGKGHPELEINYEYVDSLQQMKVRIAQIQDAGIYGIFRLPLKVDVYSDGKIQRKTILIDKKEQTFVFLSGKKPDLINVDAEKMLLCSKKDNLSTSERVFQYYNAPLYLDRYEAIQMLKNEKLPNTSVLNCLIAALHDTFWQIRLSALEASETIFSRNPDTLFSILKYTAQNDKKPQLRAEALNKLSTLYNDHALLDVFKNACMDSSYSVVASGLNALAKIDSTEGLAMALKMENEKNPSLSNALANIYSKYGDESKNEFFVNAIDNAGPETKTLLLYYYGIFLSKQNDNAIERGLFFLDKAARTSSLWYERLTALNAIGLVKQAYVLNNEKIKDAILKSIDNSEENTKLKKQQERILQKIEGIEVLESSIKNNEKEDVLIRIYKGQQ